MMGKERGVEKKEKNGGTSTRSKDEDAEESSILSDSDSAELLLSANKKVGNNEVRIFSSSDNDNDAVQVKEETKLEDDDKVSDKNVNADKKRKYVVITRILRSDSARKMEVSTDNEAAVQLPVEKLRTTEPSDDAEVPLKKLKAGLPRTRREIATGSFSNAVINGDVRKEMKEENVEDFETLDVDRTGIQCMVEKQKEIKLKRSADKKTEKIHSVEQPSGHTSEHTGISPRKDGVLRVQGKGGVLKILQNRKTSNGLENSQAERRDEGKSNVSGSSRITRASSKKTYLSQNREDDEKLSKVAPSVKDQELEGSSLSQKGSLIKRKMAPKVVSPQRVSKKLIKLDSNSETKSKSKKCLKPPACSKQETNKAGGEASTIKQKIREQIKDILLNAGWKIDLRPRNGRNYLDSVYIPPDGPGSYWSITKAYAVYQEQLNDGNVDKRKKPSAKSSKTSSGISSGTSSSSSLLPIESLNMLKRKVVNKRRSKEELEEAKRGKKRKIKASMKKENLKSYHGKSKLDGIVKRKRSKGHLDLCANDKAPSKVHKHLQTGKTKRKGCTLLARGVNQESETNSDDYFQYDGKRTVLSWMIDIGVLPVNAKVNYMNNKRTKPKLEGWITRDGIHCGCCSKILAIAKFELHGGSKVHPASEHIYVKESGVSLLDCQLNAWKKQDEPKRLGFYTIDVSGDDPNDDTCGICGDGGDLICCDGCPSTFHLSCLGIQRLPPGDWNCSNCACRYCGEVSKHGDLELEEALSPLLSCTQCEEKYHQDCVPESDYFSLGRSNSGPSFCGQSCRKVFRRLQKLLGVINDLDEGFSWSLVRRLDDMARSSFRLAQRAECNSKIAVALEVMDECFLPIIDERSGVNLIHNVVYNCGSNFNRLDYKGFYTFILERDDEIISAASVRIHGTRLAEMPFIGTRNMYRRQGMCRRLLDGIETDLRSLNVERLVIPAISELKDTWTNVFGFKPLEDSRDLDIKSINMLVFPGTGLLQKLLLKKGQDVKGDQVAADCNREDGLTLKNACESVELSASGANGHDSDQVVVYHKVGDARSCLPPVGCVDSTSNISPIADVLQNSGTETGKKAHLVDAEAYLQSNPVKISCDELIGERKIKADYSSNETLTECKAEGAHSSETGFGYLMQESGVNNEVLPLQVFRKPLNVGSLRESQVPCLEGVSRGSGDLFGGKSQTSEQGTSQDTDFLKRPSLSATHHVTEVNFHLLGPDSVESLYPPLVESVLSSNHSHRLGETFIQQKTSDGGGQFKNVACELDSFSHSCKSSEMLGKLHSSKEIDPSTPDPGSLNPDLTGSKEDDFAVQEDLFKSHSQLTAATCSLGDEVTSDKPVHPCALSAFNCGLDMVNNDMVADSAGDTL